MSCAGCQQTPKARIQAASEVRTVSNKPEVHPDKTILFPDPAPEIEHYKQSGVNEHRLVPLFPFCKHRATSLTLSAGGAYGARNACTCPNTEQFGKLVTPDICKICPFKNKR